MKKLTPKQQRFAEEYLVDLCGTQAAIRAGYSPHTANEQSVRLLATISIKAAIDKALAERSKRTGINADRVITELAKIAFVNLPDMINMKEVTLKPECKSEDTAAIVSVKVKTVSTGDADIVEREIKTADKIRALEMLGKHLGMFKDNVNLLGSLAVKFVDDIGDRND
jgi:phage terminase small subunit